MRSEVSGPGRESARARQVRAKTVKAEPVQTALAQREERARWRAVGQPRSLARREASTLLFSPRPDGEALLRAQYYFLKALAAKLDGGIGTIEDERLFQAGLAAYQAHGERLRGNLSKMLPRGIGHSAASG